MHGLLTLQGRRSLLLRPLVLIVCAVSCDREAGISTERSGPEFIKSAAVAPEAGQEWSYRDPPNEFGSWVLIADVKTDKRCGELALVQVLDLYVGHGSHLQQWITVSALKESISELRLVNQPATSQLSPGSDDSDVPGHRACTDFDETVAEMLRNRHFLRTAE
jgi:hypothetical protein